MSLTPNQVRYLLCREIITLFKLDGISREEAIAKLDRVGEWRESKYASLDALEAGLMTHEESREIKKALLSRRIAEFESQLFEPTNLSSSQMKEESPHQDSSPELHLPRTQDERTDSQILPEQHSDLSDPERLGFRYLSLSETVKKLAAELHHDLSESLLSQKKSDCSQQ